MRFTLHQLMAWFLLVALVLSLASWTNANSHHIEDWLEEMRISYCNPEAGRS